MAPDEAAALKTVAQITREHFEAVESLRAPSKAVLDKSIQSQIVISMSRIQQGFAKRDGEGRQEF
jgi:hypothetical protein